jgi:dihydrofolate reductase
MSVSGAVVLARRDDKKVVIFGASLAQCIDQGLIDEIYIHLLPTLLGDGIRLSEHLGVPPADLEVTSVTRVGQVTNLRFRPLGRLSAPPPAA